jgi:cell division transport system permease protein
VDQGLKVLFDRALSNEPLPPPGELAQEAMAGGRRQRRRRHLVVGGAAGVVTALATVFALNVATAEPDTAKAMSFATRPGCTQVATEIPVFLNDDITDAQRASLDAWLRSDPRLRQVRYESRETAYEKFRQMYRHAPDLVAAVKPGQLPESFRIEVARGTAWTALRDEIQARPGVEEVVDKVCASGQRPGEGE